MSTAPAAIAQPISTLAPAQTSSTAATPAKTNTFVSWLDHAGSVIAGLFKKAKPVLDEAENIAQDAEPFLAVLEPAVTPLFASVLGLVQSAEATAVAAGNSTGTGAQKSATIIQQVDNLVVAWGAQNKVTVSTPKSQALIDAAVAFANNLPAPANSPAVTAAPTTA